MFQAPYGRRHFRFTTVPYLRDGKTRRGVHSRPPLCYQGKGHLLGRGRRTAIFHIFRFHLCLYVSALAIFFLTSEGYAAPKSAPRLTIYAASSLQGALPEIGALYERATGAGAEFVFASSGALARKIAAGGPADLFVSAHPEWMAYLKKKGAITSGPMRVIAKNTLAAVISGEENILIARPADLMRASRIGIGDPAHVPAGRYAVAALRAAGLWTRLTKAGKIVFTRDVRSALAFAERGAISAAIVYATDARASKKVRTAFIFPEKSHPPIAYYAAVVTGGRNGKHAQKFFHFLSQESAKAIFRKHGFLAPSSDRVKP